MKRLCFLLFLSVLFSCQKEDKTEGVYLPSLMEIPEGFPAVIHPEGNEFTEARWELGKQLFFDKSLSRDSSISCASCHQPALAFSDEVDFSFGVENQIGTRNSPSLANVAYQPYLTREGGVPTLEMQVLVPIQEHNEFDFNIVLIAERLSQDSTYIKMAEDAYGRVMDAFVITRALACFERSLLIGNSLYDHFSFSDDPAVLPDAALRGMNLFFSERSNCSNCHGDFNFTNYAFENNGLYETYADEGRFRLTSNESDRALFKVPSLRNVAVTAPYMHDGRFQTLEQVVDHYNEGIQKSATADPTVINTMDSGLFLTEQDKADLINFLKTLTDETFLNEAAYKTPF